MCCADVGDQHHIAIELNRAKGQERKVIRAGDAAADRTRLRRTRPQGMPLTGYAPLGQRPLWSLPPRVWNGRNQAAVQKACACV
jgi:hypothetical protein